MLRFAKGLIIFVLFFSVSGKVWAQQSQLIIQVKDVAEIESEYIKVCDVAAVLAADNALARQVENMVIRKAPNPGKSIELRSVDVKACLIRNRIEAEDLQIGGSPFTLVTSRALTVTSSQITQAARDFVLREMPWEQENVRLEILSSPSDIVVADGDLTFEVYPSSKNYYVGQVVINVKVFVNGSLQKKIPVTMRIRVYDDVVVVNRSLTREEIITPSYLSVEKREVSGIKGGYFTDVLEVDGKVAKIRIKSQSILRNDMVVSPLMIKRNELVKVMLSMKNLKITSRAIARQDGREGEFIAVKNIDDAKKEFYGLVIAPGVVRVDL